MRRILITPFAVITAVLMVTTPGVADPGPYDDSAELVCSTTLGPGDVVAEANEDTGAVLASASVGSDYLTGHIDPLPYDACAWAQVSRFYPDLTPGDRWQATVRLSLPTGTDAPSASANLPGANARATASITVWERPRSCPSSCYWVGVGYSIRLACAPQPDRCTAGDTVELSYDFDVPDEDLFIEVEAGVQSYAASGYVGNARSSVSAVVEDISLGPATSYPAAMRVTEAETFSCRARTGTAPVCTSSDVRVLRSA